MKSSVLETFTRNLKPKGIQVLPQIPFEPDGVLSILYSPIDFWPDISGPRDSLCRAPNPARLEEDFPE